MDLPMSRLATPVSHESLSGSRPEVKRRTFPALLPQHPYGNDADSAPQQRVYRRNVLGLLHSVPMEDTRAKGIEKARFLASVLPLPFLAANPLNTGDGANVTRPNTGYSGPLPDRFSTP